MLLKRIKIKFSISPLDDRYINKLKPVEAVFSEKNLVHSRITTEVKWLSYLAKNNIIPQTKINLTNNEFHEKLRRFDTFSDQDFQDVKKIEAITNHDVKAVEYFVKKELEQLGFSHEFREFTHFLCTSEDINNIAYSLMLRQFKNDIYIPSLKTVISNLKDMALTSKNYPMISLTHGQPATPTTMGKELANFAFRFHRQLGQIEKIDFLAKMNGATGSFNAHYITNKNLDWIKLVSNFIENDLHLKFNFFTTQIEPHDSFCEFFSRLSHTNTIGIGLCQDMWGYISRGYFVLKLKKGEIGSSIMPHKVNPIDLENAEGNFGISNSLFDHFSRKLPISRYQRDLSDSTVMRNIGVAAGHTMLSFQSLQTAFAKMTPSKETMSFDLNNHFELLAEPIQQILRMKGHENAYEILKDFTRGQKITQASLKKFILELNVDNDTREQLLLLKPEDYIGKAAEIVDYLNKIM